MANQAAMLFSDSRKPTAIGVIECDVLVEQDTKLSADVTKHPVEEGFPIHDHISLEPMKLSMTVVISNNPVTWFEHFGGPDPHRTGVAQAKFEELYKARQPITIVTPTRIYQDMVMTSAAFPHKREDGGILKVPVDFVQIRKVKVKTADIPEEQVDKTTRGKAGETEKDAGAALQQEAKTSETEV